MDQLLAQNLINCPDGSKADPSIGCVKTPGNVVNPDSSIIDILLSAATLLMTAAAAIAIVSIIWGGIQYATAVGDEEKINHAKRIIFYSVLGLILALLARYVAVFLTGIVG